MKSLISAIVLAIILTWFALANSQIVTVSILVWSIQVSLSLVMLLSILIGVIFTGILSAGEQSKMYAKIKNLEKELKHDEDILKGEKKE
jgi:uncharacterized integral membrane protein